MTTYKKIVFTFETQRDHCHILGICISKNTHADKGLYNFLKSKYI